MEFVVIRTGGRQFRLSPGDSFVLGSQAEINPEVLLWRQESGEVLVGQPIVPQVGVTLELTETRRGEKISVRRFKSKSRYRRKKGHRQPEAVYKLIKIGTQTEVLRPKVEDKIEGKDKLGAEEAIKGSGENKEKSEVVENELRVAKTTSETAPEPTEKPTTKPKTSAGNGLAELKLSTRAQNALTKAEITTTNQLKKLTEKDLEDIRGIGAKTRQEIINVQKKL